jgi:SAM-dependent methyltransferase
VLELGHGPGHLQVALKQKGIFSVGLDASRSMSAIARRRLLRNKFPAEIILSYAQNLAFASGFFSNVVATFPSDYIFDESTPAEIYRVLAQHGRLVVIMGGWLTGQNLCQRLTGWLLGRPVQSELEHTPRWLEPFQKAGFSTQTKIIDLADSQLFMILASKSENI